MDDVTYDFPLDGTPMPAGTWTKIVDGPVRVDIAGSDNFHFRVGVTGALPTADWGYQRLAGQEVSYAVPASRAFYVYNPLRKMKFCVTTTPLA